MNLYSLIDTPVKKTLAILTALILASAVVAYPHLSKPPTTTIEPGTPIGDAAATGIEAIISITRRKD